MKWCQTGYKNEPNSESVNIMQNFLSSPIIKHSYGKLNIQHIQNTHLFNVHASQVFMLLENVLKDTNVKWHSFK